jgi:hypothetical protein
VEKRNSQTKNPDLRGFLLDHRNDGALFELSGKVLFCALEEVYRALLNGIKGIIFPFANVFSGDVLCPSLPDNDGTFPYGCALRTFYAEAFCLGVSAE